ncbi:unnamed protein product, partial [Oncorhynchus mykiss]
MISTCSHRKARFSPYEYGSFVDNASTLSSEAITDSIASDANYGYMERSLESVAGRSRQESLSSIEEDDYDTLADIDSDKNIVCLIPPPFPLYLSYIPHPSSIPPLPLLHSSSSSIPPLPLPHPSSIPPLPLPHPSSIPPLPLPHPPPFPSYISLIPPPFPLYLSL